MMNRRSLAAKKGWETRRKAALAKQRRSEAAKRGWQTRRDNQAERAAIQSESKKRETFDYDFDEYISCDDAAADYDIEADYDIDYWESMAAFIEKENCYVNTFSKFESLS